ncbi:MAG: hypothetical protein K1X88_13360 [Nannocystaceae bacterium]|nr:hypothetical protein [Nannocystaceae bacterium]
MIARALLLAAALVPATACPRTDPVRPPDATAGDDGGPPPTRPRCGDGHTALEQPALLPATASLVAVIELDAATLPASLATLSRWAHDGRAALPVQLAFSLAQWRWQVPLVREQLARAGFVAAHLLAVRLDDAIGWVLPLGCSMDDAIAALQRDPAWHVNDTGGAAIATAHADGPAPWDLLVREGVVALVPAGRARAWLSAWSRGASDSALGPPSLAAAALALPAAPIRLRARTTGLLPTGAVDTAAAELALLVDGETLRELPPGGDTPGATLPAP